MQDITLGLQRALESGDCVLFVGAGINHYLKDNENNKPPDANELKLNLIDNFRLNIDNPENYNLSQIAQLLEGRGKRKELLDIVKRCLRGLHPDENLKWIFSRSWKAIYTTNYDNAIQKTYDRIADPKQNYITIPSTKHMIQYDTRFDVPIFHLHGALFEEESPNIIITKNDYTKYLEKRRMLYEQLKNHLLVTTILYIGYRNEDPDWEMIVNELKEEFYPDPIPTSYRIDPFTDVVNKELLAQQNIFTLDMKLDEFVSKASSVINEHDLETSKEALKHKVPEDLKDHFERNPAATTRLLNSWEYVNQANFAETKNVNLFLKGDKPNWSIIDAKNYFKRDIEDDIWDKLVDFATRPKQQVEANKILAPAGYGITTLLMTLAVRIIKEKAGVCFYLKPGKVLIEGDIEYAAQLFTNCFFIIDDITANIKNLKRTLQIIKEKRIPAFFLVGSRLNEWKQHNEIIPGDEFLLDPLSDIEIESLIYFLHDNNALGELKNLEHDLQFQAIKKNYNKELLVAMREATEGENFDAILLNEYQNINDDLAKSAYLITCCFFQFGVYIRDNLLADILSVDLVDMYHQYLNPFTEGVVLFDELDRFKGVYGARARHRLIAKVIWERAGNPSEKHLLIIETLDHLNLNFINDAKAFENFYRSDHLIDALQSFDDKVRFFEKCIQKDPDSPYIRQHYSRMLRREKRYNTARAQIDDALTLDNSAVVLYHTKGLINKDLMDSAESLSIARKYLIQSESCFIQGKRMNSKDAHFYQGLSDLYLSWATKCQDQTESAEYISKAESIINEGLSKVNKRDTLWISSANIQRFLGDNPTYIKYLENAVRESPYSTIARYLLGRAYRKQGNYQQATNILYYTIQNEHDEYRSFVEYALCKHYLGSTYKECISILNQSTLYGLKDPRFISTLGGLYFLDNQISKSDEIFNIYKSKNFDIEELYSIQFRPCHPSNPNKVYQLTGRINELKSGYCWIETEQFYHHIFCPGTKLHGLHMQRGLHVSFHLCFTVKGTIADNVNSA